jgi:predicted nucleotidyltransferase
MFAFPRWAGTLDTPLASVLEFLAKRDLLQFDQLTKQRSMSRIMSTILSERRRFLKEALRQKALEMLVRAAELLYAEGAEEVIAFGSVLKPEGFDEHSDVDITVKGLAEEKKTSLERKLEDIFVDIAFDVVFLEDEIRAEIREKIVREGMIWKR